jgi:uncharacterized protein (DUF4415 family)
MGKHDHPVVFDDENPEWTEEMFAQARPASELFPSHMAAMLIRKGRPKGSTSAITKRQVTLRLDQDVIEKFKAGGQGWQSRMNEALKRAG